MVIGKFDPVQLLLRPFQVSEDILAAGAVFPAEPVDGVEPRLDLLQLLGGVGEGVPAVPEPLGGVLDLIHQILHPLMQLGKGVVIPGDAAERPLGLGHETGCAVRVVRAVQTLHALVDGVGELFRVLQDLSSGFQGVVLAGLQVRPGDLVDLKAQ